MLNADFSFLGGVLTLDNFDNANHDITIDQSAGSKITLELANGDWDGTNGAEATGQGSSTLTVQTSLVDQIIINDTLAKDFDVAFNTVDMTSLGKGLNLLGVNDVSQSGAVDLGILNFFGSKVNRRIFFFLDKRAKASSSNSGL